MGQTPSSLRVQMGRKSLKEKAVSPGHTSKTIPEACVPGANMLEVQIASVCLCGKCCCAMFCLGAAGPDRPEDKAAGIPMCSSVLSCDTTGNLS